MLTIAAKKKHRGIKLNPVERVGMAVVYLICIMAGILTIVPFLYIVAGSFADRKRVGRAEHLHHSRIRSP